MRQEDRVNSFDIRDSAIILFCLAGALFCLNAFRLDFNKTLLRFNEQPVGIITFKYKAAQRRFVDRVLWDRLQRESPVYNGDLIRTAELSEATITFADGGVIDLAESTLVQVFSENNISRIDVSSGALGVNAAESKITISSGNNVVTVNAGAVISAKAETDGAFNLQVAEGSAVLNNATGIVTAAKGEAVSFLADGGAKTEAQAVVISPRSAARLVAGTERIPVVFAWNAVNYSGETRIELAEDRGFTKIAASFETAENNTAPELAAGVYFWRVYPAGSLETGAATGKLTILYAPPPRLVTPGGEQVFSYRAKLPAVRFQWTESAEASYYLLEAADNPALQNPALRMQTQNNTAIAELGSGRWYWRVTPFYPADYTISGISSGGAGLPSAPGTFVIQQDAGLKAPILLAPAEAANANIAASGQNIFFSWRKEAEAAQYTLRISSGSDLGNPLITRQLTENYYILVRGDGSLRPGQYYWGVTQSDSAGNSSPVSEVRFFRAIEENFVQQPVFPPDNYTVEDNLFPDLRFTWKTNISSSSRFQISDSADFSRFSVDETVNGEAFQGRALAPGDYYWRISAAAGDQLMQTTPRRLTIAPSLPPPELGAAKESTPDGQPEVMVIQAGEKTGFVWTQVPGADFYRFKLYEGSVEGNPVYEDLYVTDNSADVPMDKYEGGNYVWTVQAFTNERTDTSRRTGSPASGQFTLERVEPVVLDNPKTSKAVTVLSGQPAEKVPAPQSPARQPAEEVPVPQSPAAVPASPPAAEAPVPRLRPAAAVMQPPDGYVLGPAELRTRRSITFSWTPVAGANGYLFSLYHAASGERIVQMDMGSGLSYTLENLSLLDRGTFIWQVEAVNRTKDGLVEQRGKAGENRFTVDIPEIPRNRPRETGALYGK